MSEAHQNVLLIAYGCEPGRGSEAGIGWSHAVETAKARPTWIICHPSHRVELDKGIADWNRSGQGCPMHAVYIDASPLMQTLEGAGYFGFNVYYYAWIRAAAKVAVRLHQEVGFAVAQHVSLTRWWMPSPATAVAERGVPLLFGPVGAGECMPWSFRRGIGMRGFLTEISRTLARRLFQCDPMLKRNAQLATGVVETDETERRLRSLGCKRVLRAASLPCDPEQMQQIEPMPKKPGTFRIVSGGGLVYWKSFHLSVRAFAEAFGDEPNVEYVHVCGGEQMERIRREAEQLGVADRVHLTGDTPHLDNLRWVKSADVYALPTMRDTTAHLFEALSVGVPCVVADHLSPRSMIDETCGIRVPLDDGPKAFVAAMARAFRVLYDDTQKYSSLSDGARTRSGQLSRETFGRTIRQAQGELISASAKSPKLPTCRTCKLSTASTSPVPPKQAKQHGWRQRSSTATA